MVKLEAWMDVTVPPDPSAINGLVVRRLRAPQEVGRFYQIREGTLDVRLGTRLLISRRHIACQKRVEDILHGGSVWNKRRLFK